MFKNKSLGVTPSENSDETDRNGRLFQGSRLSLARGVENKKGPQEESTDTCGKGRGACSTHPEVRLCKIGPD